MTLGRVHIVGAGLIGTSVGLAARMRRVDVTLSDADPQVATASAERGAGTADPAGIRTADVIVVAVPPRFVSEVCISIARLNPNATIIDVASVKSNVLRDVETAERVRDRFVPTHPMAGRERGGPLAGRADLFLGRAWVLTPGRFTAGSHLAAAQALVELCGARPVLMTAQEHDAAVALISHAPQLVASVLAGQLVDAPFDVATLAGTGVRDMTRLAASDPELWADICSANSVEVRRAVTELANRLAEVAAGLEESPADIVRATVAQGRTGRARLGAAHGRPAVPVDTVTVLLRDQPGELAGIFTALGAAEVNVDDLRIDHAPGEAIGVLELAVPSGSGPAAVEALADWTAHVATRDPAKPSS